MLGDAPTSLGWKSCRCTGTSSAAKRWGAGQRRQVVWLPGAAPGAATYSVGSRGEDSTGVGIEARSRGGGSEEEETPSCCGVPGGVGGEAAAGEASS